MEINIVANLINNVALLMALSIIQEISYIIPIRSKKLMSVFQGLLIGNIALAIMTIPFRLETGIVFDTRSILISVTGLTFGYIPTLIAASMAIAYRFLMGGYGVWMGVLTIISSALIGIAWRHHVLNKTIKYRWLNVYLFGIVVHITMLACTDAIPQSMIIQVLKQISLPIMLIFPVGTVLLSLLLLHQKERDDAFKKVLQEDEWYKSLFNNKHTVMLLIDSDDAQIIDANPAACSFYGWTLEELKSMNLSEINTSPKEEILAKIKKSISGQYTYFTSKHRRAFGEPIDVEVYRGPLKLNGKIVIYSIVHDISKRLAANQALYDSEKRFRLLVESAPDAIYIQADGKFAFLNQCAISLFGAESAESLIGTAVTDRYHPDFRDNVRERINILNIQKKPVPLEEQVILKMDGSPLDVDINAVPIHFNLIDGALVFARDISERKRIENAKIEVEAQLRQKQKLEAIGTLAGGVAHEINNPINGIMNYAQLILDAIDKSSAQAEYATEIIHETERVSAIVKNLLQFSRQEKQSHSFASISDIVNQTTSLIKTLIKKDQISLDIKLEENLPKIKCRSQQIQQVMMNLLTNARDAINEKFPDFNPDKIIRLTGSQFVENGEQWIRIIVEDHGNGIPKEVQEKIFEPFFSTKSKEKGTGLGLSISFGIISEHRGRIKVDTKQGCYTKFILDLPVDNGWEI